MSSIYEMRPTMWNIRIFESWGNQRVNDIGSAELCNFGLK